MADVEVTDRIKGSILQDIKQMIGQEWDDDSFDLDITNHINTVFFTLNQIGVGPDEGFAINDAADLWDSYLQGTLNLNAVKSYIYLRVRLLFDPPANGFLVTSMQEQIAQLEWRLQVEQDPPVTDSELGEING